MTQESHGIFAFLGGTTASGDVEPWRPPFIKWLVKEGIPKEALFNPVLRPGEWNKAAQEIEDAAKEAARCNLFYLTNPRSKADASFSIYGYIQFLFKLYKFNNEGAVAVFDIDELSGHTKKAVAKIQRDLEKRFGDKIVKENVSGLVQYMGEALRDNPYYAFFAGGTCGNNTWRERQLIPLALQRGISRDRIINPNVPPGMWNKAVQSIEDQAFNACSHGVYYFGDPQEERKSGNAVSLYSNIETLTGLFDDTGRTVAVIDYRSFDAGHSRDSIKKMHDDFKEIFPYSPIFDTLEEAGQWMLSQYNK